LKVLPHALSLTQKYGVSVVPIKNGGKSPPEKFRWKDYQSKIMTEADVRRFMADSERLGLVCGAVSGHLECIDFDVPGLYEKWRELLDHNGQTDLTDKLVIERTPRGGAHVYYRCRAGIEGNQKLARRFATQEELNLKPMERAKATIETRGEGGLIVCQPTEGYTPLQSKFSLLPDLSQDDRDLLLSAARSFDEVSEERQDVSRKDAAGDSDGKPGSDFNRRSNWRDLLEPMGWKYLFTHGSRDYWERPGKSKRETSATTGNGEHDLLYIHSTSCYPLDANVCYSKFAVHAFCNHNGDFSAAAKSLSSRGFGMARSNGSVPPDASAQSSAIHLNGHATQEQYSVHGNGALEVPPDNPRVWFPKTYNELLSTPPKTMIVDGLIGEKDNFMIFGLPKSGKTFVTIDLMLACVSGGAFAQIFEVTRPLHVAYLTNEGLGALPRRISACAQYNGIEFQAIQTHLHVFTDVPQLYSNQGPASIAKFTEDWIQHMDVALDILIIDTLNKATLGADENSNSDAAIIATHLADARKRLYCATGLVHHAGKDGERVRGASAFDGDLDLQLKVVRDPALRYLKQTMAKDLGDFEDISFKLAAVDDTCAVHWLGAVEGPEGATALNAVVNLMGSAREKEWWSIGQLADLLPRFGRDAVRKACAREVTGRDGGLLKCSLDMDGQKQTLYGLK
jgi:hypothetical protein